MARKTGSAEDAPIDVFEAVKRGFIHKGIIPRRYRRNAQASSIAPSVVSDSDEKPNQTHTKKSRKRLPTQESHPENQARKAKITQQDGDQVKLEPIEPEPGDVHEKLIDLTEKAHDTLFKADTVFPFTMFPDTITLDREKLTIANRSFFRIANITAVPINSMVSAEATVGPFFGSLHMTSKYFVQNTHSINFLWRKDAIEVQRLLQGYIIAQERGVDVSEVDKEDLIALLHDLGQGVSD